MTAERPSSTLSGYPCSLAGTQEVWIGALAGLSIRTRWQPTRHRWQGKHGHDADPDQMHSKCAEARRRPMTTTQDDAIAEFQRTIAELRRQRDERESRAVRSPRF